MSRTGIPMARRPSRIVVTISVLVEPLDGSDVYYETWTGSSATGIRKAARAKYEGIAKLSFGNATEQHFWGAH